MIALLIWTLLILALGMTHLPITVALCKGLYGRGVILSPLIGTLLLTLSTWLIVHTRLLDFSQTTILLVWLMLIAINAVTLQLHRSTAVWLRGHIRPVLATILLTTLPLLLFVVLRSMNPNIDNFEKFMDMNFVSALVTTVTFPPQDTWYAGESINYYYFGHLVYALLIKLTGVPLEVGYNLAISTLFAFAISAGFALGSTVGWLHISRHSFAIKVGILTTLLINCAGTLYTFSFMFDADREPFWFWSSLRLIPNAIHEFPAYTFGVSDLHAHVLNVPHVLLALNVLLILLLSILKNQVHRMWTLTALLGGVLAIILMTSAWDFPMYAGLSGLAILVAVFIRTRSIKTTIAQSGLMGILLLAVVALLSSFFLRSFDSSVAGGIGLVFAHTSLKHFLILWGPQLFIALTALYWIWKYRPQLTVPMAFGLGLFAWAAVLLIVPEIIYLKDIYGADNHRLNTILKFYYQAFIVAQAASAVWIMILTHDWTTRMAKAWKVLVIAAFTPLLMFPFQLIPDYYLRGSTPPSLDGMQFFSWSMQDDRAAIEWLRNNVSHQAVIAEAPGDSYTHESRISTFTGLPTVQGWFVHEWLWRGGTEGPSSRVADLGQLYEGSTVDQLSVIEKYNIEYIVIGNTERKKYPNLARESLASLGTVVFEKNSITIIEVSTPVSDLP